MVMALTTKVVLGYIGFVMFWMIVLFLVVPFLPIGRIARSMLWHCLWPYSISPNSTYATIDLPILGLFFDTKVNMFKYLEKLFLWHGKGDKDIPCRVLAPLMVY
ncbi:hypothetical protein SUGI_0210340 [Cryptomeria japonica]|nr:hypothetical protein SUGI_0210340 [Cryptomeria japonica]